MAANQPDIVVVGKPSKTVVVIDLEILSDGSIRENEHSGHFDHFLASCYSCHTNVLGCPSVYHQRKIKKKKERASLRCKHHIHIPEDAAERVKQEMRKSNLFVALLYYTINNKLIHRLVICMF